MSTSMLLGIFDWIGDFFKSLFDLVPKIMYLLYASMACVLDVLQLFFRKLAGLDVYYVDGKAVSGDLVTNFIAGILGIQINETDGVKLEYSALTTVFWSMVVFGIIMVFVSVFVSIIKSHYNYDEKAAKGPMQYVYAGGKAIVNIVAVPVIVILGLYVSQSILTALDSITSITSGSIESLYGDKSDLLVKIDTVQSATGLKDNEQTVIFYDIFGFGGSILYGPVSENETLDRWLDTGDMKKLAFVGAKNQTFSGSLFKVAAYNANRARNGSRHFDIERGEFFGGKNDEMDLFANASTKEELADMIDTALANNLHLKKWGWIEDGYFDEIDTSLTYFTNFLAMGADNFSKFNVGIVWYYYDLWQFNFIVGFAGGIVCVTLFLNIILGMITRLFMCIGLFLIYPPCFGLAPLDDNKASKGWRENFMKQVLMAYGAVIGMNIFFLIMPYMNTIDFFNIAIADYLAQTLMIIVGLISIKAFIAVVSGLVGGADANETGGKIADEVGQVAGKAVKMTAGAAKLGMKGLNAAYNNPLARKMQDGLKKKAQEQLDAGHRVGGGALMALAGLSNMPRTIMGAGKRAGGLVKRITGQGQVEEMEKFQKQNELLKSLAGKRGNDFDETAFRNQAIKAGLSGSDLDNMVGAARAAATAAGSGNMTLGGLRTELVDREGGATRSAYQRGMNEHWNNRNNFKHDMNQRSAVREQRLRRASAVGEFFTTPLKNLDDAFGGHGSYKKFKETVWKPEDYTKTTAKYTKKIDADMRTGMEELHDELDEIKKKLP